ncbi:MAG: HAD family hydrolase [Alphaproteobacteria bacterium]|nr:MAG: HAD family hydrolase [Alphaproteobacteria bacterium]
MLNTCPMIKAVLFDLDNTLLNTQELYVAAEADLTRMILSLAKADLAEVAAEIQRRKLTLFDVYGYDPAMLPQAFEEALINFAPAASADDILQARALGRRIFEEEAEIEAGAEDALRRLSGNFTLYLVTVGDEETQQRRIAALSCGDVFREKFIVSDKTRETYLAVLSRSECAPDEAVMIGDSLKSDIIPAVQAGMTAIHIPANNWHGREMQGYELPQERAVTHRSLSEAVDFLLSLQDAEAAPAPEALPRHRHNRGARPGY